MYRHGKYIPCLANWPYEQTIDVPARRVHTLPGQLALRAGWLQTGLQMYRHDGCIPCLASWPCEQAGPRRRLPRRWCDRLPALRTPQTDLRLLRRNKNLLSSSVSEYPTLSTDISTEEEIISALRIRIRIRKILCFWTSYPHQDPYQNVTDPQQWNKIRLWDKKGYFSEFILHLKTCGCAIWLSVLEQHVVFTPT